MSDPYFRFTPPARFGHVPGVQRHAGALALDEASVRSIDRDGYLHVATSVISAAGISGYYGREIVNWPDFGLDPNAVYKLFRSPSELAKAAPTFAGKPLLSQHRPVTADDHSHDLVVGAVSEPVWEAPNLKAGLVVWDSDAIKAIQDGSSRAISCAYRYQYMPGGGSYLGESYDGQMVGLVGNHVALVSEGRVPGAIVGDAMPKNGVEQMAAYNTNKDDSGRDVIDERDDWPTQLFKFLADKIDSEDMVKVETIIRNGNPDLGMDSQLRARAQAGVVARNAGVDAGLRQRFPGIAALKHR